MNNLVEIKRNEFLPPVIEGTNDKQNNYKQSMKIVNIRFCTD